MPPNHEFRCEYLFRWKVVLDEHGDLRMRSSEKRIFDRQLVACNKDQGLRNNFKDHVMYTFHGFFKDTL